MIRVLPPPAIAARQQRGKHGLDSIHAGSDVGNGDAESHGCAVRLAGYRHETRLSLDDEVVSGFLGARTRAAVAGN